MKKEIWILGLIATELFANPTTPALMQGEASFRTDGSLLEVTASDRSIIDWHSFSIAPDEITRFLQPDAKSTVLNRVTGNLSSLIEGVLEANGRVILVNPNGIAVSSSGVIQASEFFTATFDPVNKEDWSFNLNPAEWPSSSPINLEGIIRATGMKEEHGSIFLVADTVNISGKLEAPSGHIEVMGTHLSCLEQSEINVSGESSAGSVSIGREGTALLQIGRESSIFADALVEGNGGKVILWGDANAFLGNISAQGGPEGGNGGFVEVSGHQLLFDGKVNPGAPKGSLGLLYLDPTDVNIGAVSDAGVVIGNPTTWTGPGCPVNISAAAIGAALDIANVTINTATPPSLCGTGVITLPQGTLIGWGLVPSTLTLIADSVISIQGGIVPITNGPIVLTAPTVIIGDATNTMPATLGTDGPITINASNSLSMIAGNGGGNVTVSQGGLVPLTINAGTFTVDATASTDSILVGSPFAGPLLIDVANNFTLTAANNATVTVQSNDSLDLSVGGDLQIQSNGGNNVKFDIVSATMTPSSMNIGGNLTAIASAGGAYQFSFQFSFLTVDVGNDVNFTNTSHTPAGVIPLGIGGIFNVGGDFNLTGTGMGASQVTSNRDLTLNIAGDFNLLNTGPSSTTMVVNGTLNINTGNNVSIQNTSGAPIFLGAAIAGTAAVNMNAGGSVLLGTSGAVYTGVNGSGSIFIRANDNITMGPNSAIDALLGFMGTLSSATLVVDNAFPTSPLIGFGAFSMDPSAVINTGPIAPIQIFTALRSQNSIGGLINGFPFVPGAFNVNTATEQWAQYYPQAFVGFPFTIFYKEPQSSATVVSVTEQTIGTIYDLLSEFAYPLPYFDDQFCISYKGSNFANGLFASPLSSIGPEEGTNCPWIQVDNYRKVYPSLERWGYVNMDDSQR